MENMIGQKANAFLLLADRPGLLVLFCLTLAALALVAAAAITGKSNPGLFNRLLERKKQENKKGKDDLRNIKSLLKDTLLQSCVAVIYSRDAPPLEIFNAAIVYFKNNGNGNVSDRVKKTLVANKENVTLWRSALNEDMRKNGPCENRYFLETVREIGKGVC